MIRYHFLNFLRSKAYGIGLVLLWASGLVSLEIGARFLEKAALVSELTAKHQTESIQRNLGYFNTDRGDLMYYLKFGLENQVPNLAGLAIGQRDVYPGVQSLTIRNLEEQRYTIDLVNPLFQLLGTMDFSFVLIYLFPLVIISFGFNLISEEKESGTWSLVRSQSTSALSFLKYKLGIRLLSILVTLLCLLAIGKVYLAIPLDRHFLIFVLVSILYVLFWFALTWWVVSFNWSSSQNAQTLLSLWVFLLLIIPAAVASLQRIWFPIPEALTAVMENREGYHSQWDLPKGPTLDKFYQKYPQYASFTHPEDKDFSWLWYYAMQQQGDEQAAPQVKAMQSKLAERQKFAEQTAWFLPSLHAQMTLSMLSLSDLQNYLNYLAAMEEFHEQLKGYFLPKVFDGTPVANEKWEAFQLEKFHDKPSKSIIEIFAPFVIVILCLLLWATFNYKKIGLNTN